MLATMNPLTHISAMPVNSTIPAAPVKNMVNGDRRERGGTDAALLVLPRAEPPAPDRIAGMDDVAGLSGAAGGEPSSLTSLSPENADMWMPVASCMETLSSENADMWTLVAFSSSTRPLASTCAAGVDP